MRGPVHALLWELWRLSRWEFLLRTFCTGAAGCLVFYMVAARSSGSSVTQGLAVPMAALAAMGSLFSGVWINVFDNRAKGFCFYLGFVRPVSTPLLVGVPMLYITFLTGLAYLIPAVLMRRFCEVFPILPVTALVVTICATLIMAVWSGWSLFSRGAFFSAIMIAWIAVGMAWLIRDPGGFDPLTVTPEGLLRTFSFSPFHYVGLSLACVMSIVITIFMVERQRHGDTFQLTDRIAALFRRECRLSRTIPPFRSPYHAQFWLEMRRSGIPLLWVSVAAAVTMFLFFTLLQAFAHISRLVVDAPKSLAILWLVAIALSPSVYMLIGTEWLLGLTRRQGVACLSTFEGTQPMRNTSFLLIKLFVLTASVIAGLALMTTAGGIWFALFGDRGDWRDVAESVTATLSTLSLHPLLLTLLVLYVCSVTFIAWAALVYIGGLWLALHPWLFAIAYIVGLVYFGLACFGHAFHWRLGLFWEIHAWLLSLFFVALAAVTLRTCIKRGYLGATFLFAMLCAWAAYLAILVVASSKLASFWIVASLSLRVLAFSTLTLPLTAAASAPLSLGAFRHR